MSSRPTGEAVQEGKGVAGELGSMELGGVWRPTVTADLAAFLLTAEATVAALERGRRGIYNVVERRARPRGGPDAGVDAGDRRQAAPTCAPLAGAAAGRRGVYDHDDRGAWRLQRQGQA